MDAPRQGTEARQASAGIASAGDYLGFIDGLRAISILAVVAFHIGLPAPSGGFFGVDIFFVISGFLIIGQIVADCEAGTFRFGRFWARRVLRILPSYLLVVLVCVAASFYLLVTPSEFFDFSEEVMWSAGMAMNSWLIRHVGYFDTDSNVKVLLHLWSLSVEEQFYIVAPVVIALFFLVTGWIKRLVPRWLLLPAGVAIAFMWSFGLTMRVAPSPNSDLFFHTEHRAWEFVAGGAAAMLVPRLKLVGGAVHEAIAALGTLCIIGAIFGFGLLDSFPSWQTALPVAGAALLLGSGAAHSSLVTRMLSWRPLRGIGLVSYAWYLWHWPLMSFAYITHFGDHGVILRTACAVVSFGLAVLTYLLIEQPLRHQRRTLARAMPWRIVAIGLAACLATMTVGWWMSTKLVPEVALGIPASMVPGRDGPDPDCALARVGSVDPCLARKGNRPSILLIGDSHASVAAEEFQEIAVNHSSWLITMGIDGCDPFIETHVVGPSQKDSADCSSQQQSALSLLDGRNTALRGAIIEAQWIFHTTGNRPFGASPSLDDHQGFIDAMHRTLDALERLGVKKTLVLAPIPLYALGPGNCVVRADRVGASRDMCSQTRAAADQQRATALAWLKESVAGRSDAMLADPISAFCDITWCRPYSADTVYYADFSHLGHAGEEALYAATKPGFDWLFAPN